MAGSQDPGELVRQALDNFSATPEAGPILERCIRIAELQRDYYNLWWLRREAIGLASKRARAEQDAVMKLLIPAEHYGPYREKIIEDMIECRAMIVINDDHEPEDKVAVYSVGEIDSKIVQMDRVIRDSAPPQGLDSDDLYKANRRYISIQDTVGPVLDSYCQVRARIREALHRYLVGCEGRIAFGQTAANSFERVRRYVDGELSAIGPEVLAEFRAAYERADTGTPAALSQALLSCRRVIIAVADVLYPARRETIQGRDGKPREMTQAAYRNRLWQYIAERVESETTRDLILATLHELGRRLDHIDSLANKGLHATVSADEADQCILQTYLLVGDLLRLRTTQPSVVS